jgi:hypothetical protein
MMQVFDYPTSFREVADYCEALTGPLFGEPVDSPIQTIEMVLGLRGCECKSRCMGLCRTKMSLETKHLKVLFPRF